MSVTYCHPTVLLAEVSPIPYEKKEDWRPWGPSWCLGSDCTPSLMFITPVCLCTLSLTKGASFDNICGTEHSTSVSFLNWFSPGFMFELCYTDHVDLANYSLPLLFYKKRTKPLLPHNTNTPSGQEPGCSGYQHKAFL